MSYSTTTQAAAMQAKESELDSRVLQIRQELGQKFTQDRSEISSRGDELLRAHQQEIASLEEKRISEQAEMKKAVNLAKAEAQEARDGLLAEAV